MRVFDWNCEIDIANYFMNRRQCLASLAGIATAMASASLQAGPARFEMALPLLDGSGFLRLGADEAKGQRATVINFWDTQCPPCLEELPMLDQLSQAWKGVLWVGVSLSAVDASRRYLQAHPVRYVQLKATQDARAMLRRAGNTSGALPYTLLLAPAGTVCATHTGAVTQAWMEAALARCGAA